VNELIDVKRQLVNPDDEDSSIVGQCKILGLARSTYYYQKKKYSNFDLFIMSLIDRIHTAQPTFGRRRLTSQINVFLEDKNIKVNEKRIRRLMKKMGIETIYQKPNLSKLLHKQYIKPYLLKNIKITRPNQVWASDITYIPFNDGFMYLYAIIDWHTRAILGWSLSNSLENDFVINTIKETLEKYGAPEIMNSDQGSHFTSKEYIELLEKNNIKISMDGKARAIDNIRIERFWRTIKYEYLFLNDFTSPKELEKGIYNYIHFYNNYRPHQSLKNNFPMNVYSLEEYKKNILEDNTFDPNIEEYNLYDDVSKFLNKLTKSQLEEWKKELNEEKANKTKKLVFELKYNKK